MTAEIGKMVLILEYEGSRYHGFQLQANALTIQEEMEQTIYKLTGEKTRVVAASRTDAGVHAKGQVVSFWTRSALPPETFVRALNHYLPQDIAVKAAYRVGNEFDVRRHALSRGYRYYIANSPRRSPFKGRFAHLVPRPLDVEAMNQACQVLIGEHDFVSFATSLEGKLRTVRTVHKAHIERKDDLVIFDMAADSFLPHQVRNTAGALVRVGLGRLKAEEFWQIARARTPGLAGPTAPAHGLWLMRVDYAPPLESRA